MDRAFVAALAAAGLLLSADLSAAADSATCDIYVREAVAKAQGVRAFNCGYDLNDPRWDTKRSGHAAWCRSADKETVARETARRRGEIKLCQTCRAYANLAVSAAADNIKLKCGFEGPRWGKEAQAHFGWCVQQHTRPGADEKDVAAAYKASLEKMYKPINYETYARAIQTAHCKSQPRKSRARPPKQ